jgi:SAM-dependent methyltransferase
MTLGSAGSGHCIREVMWEFPFQGYMEARRPAYETITANCANLLPPGSRILDFGAGPCDTSAVLARMGFQCTAIDDLNDDWHTCGANRDRIQRFARTAGVDLIVTDRVPNWLVADSFDMVMIHDVIEHIADSPRDLLLKLIGLLRTGGYLYITVPNAVNLRKRLLVLSGRTNYPRFPAYYWSCPLWRGHKREYVKGDLSLICEYLGLKRILLRGEHHRLTSLPYWSQRFYRMTIGRIDSLRETLALIGQKGPSWSPLEFTPGILQEIRQRETPYRYHDDSALKGGVAARSEAATGEAHRANYGASCGESPLPRFVERVGYQPEGAEHSHRDLGAVTRESSSRAR